MGVLAVLVKMVGTEDGMPPKKRMITEFLGDVVHDRLAGVILLGVAEKEMQPQQLPLLRRAIPAFAVPGPVQLHLLCRQVGVAAAKAGKGIDPLTALRFSHVAQNILHIMSREGDHFILVGDVVDG